MAEQRNETVTPKTATVEPVEVTVAVRSNQAFTDLETAHVQQVPRSLTPALPPFDNQSGLSTYGTFAGMNEMRRQKKGFSFSSMKKEDAVKYYLTIGCFIAIVVTFVLSLVPIVIGAVYFRDCPLDAKIPIFLIVMGCLLFTYMGVKIIACCCVCLTGQNNVLKLFKTILKVVKIIFHLVNLVVGISSGYSVIVCFNDWQENRDASIDSPLYCNSVLYLFAFVFAILQLTYTAITTCVYGCFLCKLCLM